jgi:RNAse (barnase) inhibitor barstar
MKSLLTLLPDVKRAGVHRSHIDAAEITAAAKTLGLQEFKIDLAHAWGKAGLLKQLAATLRFPSHFGQNWDAANDCLTDLSWIDGKGWVLILLHCDVFAAAHQEVFDTAMEVLSAAAESWRERNKPFWVFVHGKADWRPKLAEIIND